MTPLTYVLTHSLTHLLTCFHNPMRWFWLDRFTEFVSGSHATAVKCVSLSEDHLHDHWPGYPIMPNSLVAEGMAQRGGLLVSELYAVQRAGRAGQVCQVHVRRRSAARRTLSLPRQILQAKEAGASVKVTAHIDGRPYAEAEIFFARLNTDSGDVPNDTRLFDPADLLHWLRLVGVFEVGVRQTAPACESQDYGFAVSASN